MISNETRKILSLPAYLKTSCDPLFYQMCSEYVSIDALAEATSWWQDNPEQLNKAWWTLNYNAVRLDPHRRVRAIIEGYLDVIAQKKVKDDALKAPITKGDADQENTI